MAQVAPTFCDEVLELVEPIACGDVAVEPRVQSHLASCALCTAALEDARRIDRLLRKRPAPAPAPHFTGRTLTRIRRERWRREQVFDTGFNLALGGLLLAVAAAAWAFAGVLGLDARLGAGAAGALWAEIVSFGRQVAPSLPLYAAAAALIAGALGLWWWAERDAAL